MALSGLGAKVVQGFELSGLQRFTRGLVDACGFRDVGVLRPVHFMHQCRRWGRKALPGYEDRKSLPEARVQDVA